VLSAGWSECIVVNGEGIVLGRLGKKALGADPEATDEAQVTVESVMDPGPGTIRPSTPLESIVKRLKERDLQRALVTTSDGRLVGVLRREDAERRLAESDQGLG
jgi:CBS domain-containing protein